MSVFRNPLVGGILMVSVLLLGACGPKGDRADLSGEDTVALKYARLMQIYKVGPAHVVVVKNPWKPEGVLHRYVLVPDSLGPVENLPEGTVVHTPLRRMTVFTSVHCNLLNELSAVEQITGVCDFEYVQSKEIVERVKAGKIGNMGSALNPNVELILSGRTDGMLVSPFEKSGYGTLERTGIPLIECADYMEPSALGRAEWVRFFGLLVGKEAEADALFDQVERRYNELCEMAAQAEEKPSLLCDLMNGAAWYVPGGKSTIGMLYQDAGSNYLFADHKESGSVRLSFETVYATAHDADVWFLKYGRAESYTYRTLAQEKAQYAEFKPFKERKVFGCNTLQVPFYDEEPFHPDILLADAIKMLHPELLPEHELYFFKPLDE